MPDFESFATYTPRAVTTSSPSVNPPNVNSKKEATVKMSTPIIPPFSSLPIRPDGPHGNAWGLYGPDDNIGRLNLLTPETTFSAIREIRNGIRISTDWSLDSMLQQPCFGRKPFEQTIINKAPRSVNDDVLVLNTQISSQWDGFRHYGYQKERLYYNGYTLEDLLATKVNGIHGESFI